MTKQEAYKLLGVNGVGLAKLLGIEPPAVYQWPNERSVFLWIQFMSNLKFTFECDLDGNSNTQRFNTLSSKFGDGYEQNIAVGINNRSGEWTYQRTAYKDEIMQIKAFFDDHKGADSFLWDSPLDGEVRVKTGEYQPRCLGGDVWQISTTFTQVFYP